MPRLPICLLIAGALAAADGPPEDGRVSVTATATYELPGDLDLSRPVPGEPATAQSLVGTWLAPLRAGADAAPRDRLVLDADGRAEMTQGSPRRGTWRVDAGRVLVRPDGAAHEEGVRAIHQGRWLVLLDEDGAPLGWFERAP